nr:hypothetical protein CFP56_25734 [Quercus suber]
MTGKEASICTYTLEVAIRPCRLCCMLPVMELMTAPDEADCLPESVVAARSASPYRYILMQQERCWKEFSQSFFDPSSSIRIIITHMSSSNSSGPPSAFGDLSIVDRGSVMPPVTRSMAGSARQINYARRPVTGHSAGAGRRAASNRNAAGEEMDDDSSSGSGDDDSSDEEGDPNAAARAQVKNEIFRLLVVFHPKQYSPAECKPSSTVEDQSDTASVTSNYWKLIELVARIAERNPQVFQHVRAIVPDQFWAQQIVANQRLRFDRIKLGLESRIARLPGGKGIPETIGELRSLYKAIDTLFHSSHYFSSRERASALVTILVDALDYMVDDEDQFPNSTTRPTFVGNGFQSERRLAGAFLAGAGEPISFINILIRVRGHSSAAFRAQSTRLQEIYNELGIICARYVTNRNVPAGERQHFSRVLGAYQNGAGGLLLSQRYLLGGCDHCWQDPGAYLQTTNLLLKGHPTQPLCVVNVLLARGVTHQKSHSFA